MEILIFAIIAAVLALLFASVRVRDLCSPRTKATT